MLSSSTIYMYQTNQVTEDTILIPKKIAKKLKIDAHFISIVVGLNQFFVKVIPTTKSSKLGLHPLLAEKLQLTTAIQNGIPLHFKYDRAHKIFYLGPTLAVIVNPIKEEEGLLFPFGNITPYAIELSEVAKNKGILLFFITPEEVNVHQYHIEGWFYNSEWKKYAFPFPNVVYNRIATRTVEQSNEVLLFVDSLNKLSIPFFNSRFFNKDEVFKALEQDIAVKRFLPYSVLLQDMNQISYMLKQHDTIYIKPIHGRLGKGIYRIHYLRETAKYKVEHANQPLAKAKFYPSIDKVISYLRPKLKTQQYQIQQGINLIHANRKPIDFRVLVQKNGFGQWTVTSIVARTAAEDLFVSNLAKGGSISSVANILPTTSLALLYTAETLTAELKRVALLLSKSFEANFDATLGELGIDMALDEQGKVWLLEINGKPSKLTTAKLQTVRIRPSVKMLIAYSLFLSRFREGERVK